MDKYYVAFYKITKDSEWQSKRLYMPYEECEKYCKEQGYATCNIEDLDKMDANQIHLLTLVVNFDGNYYLPDEEIPYPTNAPVELGKLQSSVIWDQEYAKDDIDYEEIYHGEYFDTDIALSLILPDKTVETGVSAQRFIHYYPKFLAELAKNNFAVYHNEEFTFFKWICWVKDNSIRLIHQNYNEADVKTEFDITIDKDWFFHFSQNLIKSMEEYAEADLKLYKKYVKDKYGEDV